MGQPSSREQPRSFQEEATLRLQAERSRIRAYQRKMTAVSECEYDLARIALDLGETPKARIALRRRKYRESLLSKTDQQLRTLEHLVSTTGSAHMRDAVVYGIRQAADVIKEIQQLMTALGIDEVLENTPEAQAARDNVDRLLSSRMTPEEEDAVKQELQQEIEQVEREQQEFVTENPGEEDAVPI